MFNFSTKTQCNYGAIKVYVTQEAVGGCQIYLKKVLQRCTVKRN